MIRENKWVTITHGISSMKALSTKKIVSFIIYSVSLIGNVDDIDMDNIKSI